MLNETWKALLQDYRVYHSNPVCEATHLIGIPILMLCFPLMLASLKLGALLFVVGWAFQLVGHGFQGNAPKFLGDKRNLVVGAIWWFDAVLRPTGLNKQIFGT